MESLAIRRMMRAMRSDHEGLSDVEMTRDVEMASAEH
jgi:hypothetical protein